MAGYALAEGDLAMAAGVLVCFNGILRHIEAMLTAKQCSFDFQRDFLLPGGFGATPGHGQVAAGPSLQTPPALRLAFKAPPVIPVEKVNFPW